MRINRTALGLLAFVLSMDGTLTASAQTTLFATGSTQTNGRQDTYRIPAIVRLNNGSLMAFSDRRFGDSGDIGWKNQISVYSRTSADHGLSWSPQHQDLAIDSSSVFDFAHGDAATVVDRKSGAVLMMTSSGKDGFASPINRRPLVARSVSRDNGLTWTTEEISDNLYANPNVNHLFFSSGRMIQSARVKHGKFYRIYSGVCTQAGSLVAYSDDFGKSWRYLGGNEALPIAGGDECKVEELPDGSILLSARSRKVNGRHFNIYRFTNPSNGQGAWSDSFVTSENPADGTYSSQCNGELMLVPAVDNKGKATYVMLQSAPASTDRTHIAIYWKELPRDFTSLTEYVGGWSKFGLNDAHYAYSTMILDKKGDIAFLAEMGGYQGIVFQSFSLATITGGAYSYRANPSYRTTAQP